MGPMPERQKPQLDWTADGAPWARAFGDRYFSAEGGLDESCHVFLAGNDLPGRLTDGFHVAELGFGSGLNLLVLALCWQRTGRPGTLRYTGFEAFPLTAADLARALGGFGALAGLVPQLLDQWAPPEAGEIRLRLPGVAAQVIIGDAGATLPRWPEKADAWFLDGFAPAHNPAMWGAELMAEVARHTRPGGSFATYTAAGAVRRALAASGFRVERRPGFGRKRHMSAGRLRPASDSPVTEAPPCCTKCRHHTISCRISSDFVAGRVLSFHPKNRPVNIETIRATNRRGMNAENPGITGAVDGTCRHGASRMRQHHRRQHELAERGTGGGA